MAITGELDSARFTAMSVVDAAAQLKHMVKLKVQSHHESMSHTHETIRTCAMLSVIHVSEWSALMQCSGLSEVSDLTLCV